MTLGYAELQTERFSSEVHNRELRGIYASAVATDRVNCGLSRLGELTLRTPLEGSRMSRPEAIAPPGHRLIHPGGELTVGRPANLTREPPGVGHQGRGIVRAPGEAADPK